MDRRGLSIEQEEFPEHSIYSKKYHATLRATLRFELQSFFGRAFLRRRPPGTGNTARLLHLGAGSHPRPGWVNTDFYTIRKRYRKTPFHWMADFRFPLNCNDNYWDGIFSEHTLEHFHPADALALLKELFRTLRPGCYIRICVPDLRKYVQYYYGEVPHEQFRRWETGAEALGSLTQNWGHLSVWDPHLMTRELTKCGFVEIKERDFGKSSDSRLAVELAERSWESFYMEARKPK